MRKNNPTFLFFLNRYKRYRSLHVRYASLHLLSVLLSRYVKPEQEDRIKDVLCLQNARKIYKRIINEKHLSASYRNRLIGSFRQIVQKAYTWGYITPKQQRDTEGILENLPDQQSRRKEREFYTKEQIELFLNNVEKEDRLMFRLFCYLGARISEFHGLTWDCVDV
ncbi:MAG: hypothetical protein K6E59_02335, partial [Bacilli bacterium]|nr:hypothetical protein [Bacilli bacterium]